MMKLSQFGGLLEFASEAPKLVLEEEGHVMGQSDFLFLAIGEAGDALALYDRRPLVHHAMQDARRMAHRRDRFAGISYGLLTSVRDIQPPERGKIARSTRRDGC